MGEKNFKRFFKTRVIPSVITGLAIITVAGCGNKDKEVNDNTNNDTNKYEDHNNTSVNDNVNKYDGKIVISDRVDDVYKHLELKNESKYLGDVIDFARSPIDISNYTAILHKEQEGASDAFRMLGIEDTDLSAFAIGMKPMTDRAYSVMVLKPVDGKKDIVKAGLVKLKEDTAKLFKEKLPDQSDIAKSAIISELGHYIIFVMCNDYSEVSSSIENALTNQNELNNYIVENAESFQVIGDDGVEQEERNSSEEEKKLDTDNDSNSDSTAKESGREEASESSTVTDEEESYKTEVGRIEVGQHNAEAPIDVINENNANDTLTDWQ